MQEQFARENEADNKLSKLKPSQLDQLYLRLFNTKDGILVLRDLENRSFINAPIESDIDEGIRRAYLTIVSRMKNAVTKGGS